MKLILYECKKILRIPLLVILILFTLFYYDLYMVCQYYPNDDADCVAEVELSDILMENYQDALPYSEMGILQEIKQQQVQILDSLVQKNEVLKAAGIHNYEQMRAMELDMGSDTEKAYSEITFETGGRQVFLYQTIENIEDHQRELPFIGIPKGEEEKAARKIFEAESEIGSHGSQAAYSRIARVIARNEMSLLPASASNRVRDELPKLGILLLVSCLIVILPYQIRERLALVTPLFVTTYTGRSLFEKRYIAAVVSCLLICLLQIGVFLVILQRVGILKYTACMADGNGVGGYLWFDMSFGAYLFFSIGAALLFSIAGMTVFYLISRVAANYIVGLAIGIPAAVLLSLFSVRIMIGFMCIFSGAWSLYLQLGSLAFMLIFAAVIVVMLYRRDRRRDVMA